VTYLRVRIFILFLFFYFTIQIVQSSVQKTFHTKNVARLASRICKNSIKLELPYKDEPGWLGTESCQRSPNTSILLARQAGENPALANTFQILASPRGRASEATEHLHFTGFPI
jgi:hypothetical protein